MNDPNGMVYHEGVYHLFFQHYPDSTVWGPMHWGHATSTDLVHWQEQSIKLFPDSLGYIFWPAVLAMAAVSFLTAPLGAKLAHRLPVALLKKLFALLLVGLSLQMLVSVLG